jgi:hypothetical protein
LLPHFNNVSFRDNNTVTEASLKWVTIRAAMDTLAQFQGKLVKSFVQISPHIPDPDDCFSVLKKVFFDFGDTTLARRLILLSLVFHTFTFLLEIHYLLHNFSFDLFSQYSPFLLMTLVARII